MENYQKKMKNKKEILRGGKMYCFEEDNKTNEEIFAEALIQIIENQIKIKEHLGIARSGDDCYYDNKVIALLDRIDER